MSNATAAWPQVLEMALKLANGEAVEPELSPTKPFTSLTKRELLQAAY